MNEIDDLKDLIEIPSELDLAIKSGIERGRKEKGRNVKIRKNIGLKKVVVSAASIICLIIILGITKPEFVQAIPIIGSIFKDFKYDVQGKQLKNFEEFATSVNKTIDNNGVKITINDIAIDDNIVAITMTIQADSIDQFINKDIAGGPNLNGKHIESYSVQDKKINDNTMEVIIHGNISEMNLTENIDMELNICRVGNVTGAWDFKFKTTKNGTSKYSRTIDVNKGVSLPGKLANEFKIEKLVISPFGNTLNYSGIYHEENAGMDNGINDIKGYRVTDKFGRLLNSRQAGDKGNKKGYSGKIEILSDLSKVNSVIVTPVLEQTGVDSEFFNGRDCPIYQCSVNPEETSSGSTKLMKKSRPVSEVEKKNGYAFDTVDHVYRMDNENFVSLDELVNQEIQLNKETKVIIKSIEATEEKTKIMVKVDGNYSNADISSIVLLNDEYVDTSREEDGELAKVEDSENNIVSIELKPVDTTKKYKIALPILKDPVIDDKYSIQIPVK